MVEATVTDAARKAKGLGGAAEEQAGYSRKGGRTPLAYKAHVAADAPLAWYSHARPGLLAGSESEIST